MALDMDNVERLRQSLVSLSLELVTDLLEHSVASWSPEELQERQTENHNQNLLSKLQVGDLVVFHREIYQHWAVYVGHGEVVHVTGDSTTGSTSCCPSKLKNAQIKREDFWHVADGNWASRGNGHDRRYRPLPRKDIKRNALSQLGSANYNLLERNCEHFATLCRYGVAISNQAIGLIGFNHAITTPLAMFGMLVACAVVKMSDELKAFAVFAMSFLVAVIPLVTASNQNRQFCLFTVIVVSGVIGYVFPASIVVTVSVVVIVMVYWKYMYSAQLEGFPFVPIDNHLLTAGAIVAMGVVDAKSGVFGQRIFLTAGTMFTALTAITTIDRFSSCCVFTAGLSIYGHTWITGTAIETVLLSTALDNINVLKGTAHFLVAILLMFTGSCLWRCAFINTCMIDVVKVNIVVILMYLVSNLPEHTFKGTDVLSRIDQDISRLKFLLTLIMHWIQYDTQESQAIDLMAHYGDTAQAYELICLVFWGLFLFRASRIKLY